MTAARVPRPGLLMTAFGAFAFIGMRLFLATT